MIAEREHSRDITSHPQYRRAMLLPKYKPEFVRKWEAKYGQQSS